MIPVTLTDGSTGILHDIDSPDEADLLIRLDRRGKARIEVYVFTDHKLQLVRAHAIQSVEALGTFSDAERRTDPCPPP